MAKYHIEFKLTSKDQDGSETRYVKRVIDESDVATMMTTVISSSGLDFFTLRKVVEKVAKPAKPEVKK